MDNGNCGGLAGRARRVRDRNRACRMHTQQLIEEYLEPEPIRQTRYRHIPVRLRRDLAPSANHAVVATAGDTTSTSPAQLELPWASQHETASRVNPNLTAAHVSTAAHGDPTNETAARPVSADKTAALVARLRDGEHIRRIVAYLSDTDSAPTFSPKRFAAGCLLGTAAAAMILVAAVSIL